MTNSPEKWTPTDKTLTKPMHWRKPRMVKAHGKPTNEDFLPPLESNQKVIAMDYRGEI